MVTLILNNIYDCPMPQNHSCDAKLVHSSLNRVLLIGIIFTIKLDNHNLVSLFIVIVFHSGTKCLTHQTMNYNLIEPIITSVFF